MDHRVTDRYRFGPFVLHPGTGDLHKDGSSKHKRLRRQVRTVLLKLLDHAGEVVSRKSLMALVWKDTNIEDPERGLNRIIAWIRRDLGDSADIPRYIDVVPGTGFCFIAEVKRLRPDPLRFRETSPVRPYTPFASVPNINELAPNYVERNEDLRHLVDTLLAEAGKKMIAIQGMSGAGKSVLASALCHEPRARTVFSDGIVWIGVGEETGSTILDRIKKVAMFLNEDPSPFDRETWRARYRMLLADRAVLIVLDNVWRAQDVEPFLTDSPQSRVLFTTQIRTIAAELGACDFTIEQLGEDDCRQLLAKCARRRQSRLPGIAGEIIRECGRLPFELSEVGSSLRDMPDQTWLSTLEAIRCGKKKSLHAHTKVAVDALDKKLRKRYLQLTPLLKNMSVDITILRTLWNVDKIDAAETARRLVGRSLARWEKQAIRLHDRQLEFLRSRYRNQRALTLIHGAMRLSQHAFESDPNQFASQMIGRLLTWQELTGVREFLKEIGIGAPKPWLRPLWPGLIPSGGALSRTLVGHAGPVCSVALSADGRQAISASADHTLKVWEVESGRELRTLTGHADWIYGVALSADGRRAISASQDCTLRVWDVESGQEQRTLTGHRDRVHGVALSADGRLAISASHDCTLRVWDAESGRELRILTGHKDGVLGVALSADGRLAISASEDRTLKVWDVESGQEQRTLTGHTHWVFGVALGADRRRVISASADGTLKLWDVVSGREQRTITGHADWISGVAMSADGRLAISASQDGTLRVWDVEGGEERRAITGHADSIPDVALSTDGRRAISASYDGTLKVWDVESGQEQRTLTGHRDWVHCVALSADGSRAISASYDCTLKVWDVESGQEQRTLTGHTGPVFRVALSADGRLAISASQDCTLKVWDVESGQEQRTLTGHRDWVHCVALSADGSRAVSAGDGTLNTLKVWDVESGREQRTLAGHRSPVIGVALSADGRRAISASSDGTLKVWDVEDGQEQRTLTGHTGPVSGVALSSDGRRAISASDDWTVMVWDLDSGVCLAAFSCDASATCCAVAGDRLVVGITEEVRPHLLSVVDAE